jgi:uncharacterized LabA/DUF88 family protein
VGEDKTPLAFRNACDDFISTKILKSPEPEKEDAPAKKGAKKTKVQLRRDNKLINILRNAVNESGGENDWAELGTCGSLIKRQHPDFDPRNYGYRTFTQLFEATDLFEFNRQLNGILVKPKKK